MATGIKEIDEITGGLRNKELTFIGARPGHGKTNLLGQIANLSRRKEGIFVVFSMEMSKETLLLRFNCFAARKDYENFLKGDFTDEDEKCLIYYPVPENIYAKSLEHPA